MRYNKYVLWNVKLWFNKEKGIVLKKIQNTDNLDNFFLVNKWFLTFNWFPKSLIDFPKAKCRDLL